MVLTEGDRLVRTPTYHVFEMNRPFQGATHVPIELETPDYRLGDVSVPSLHASAAVDSRGILLVGLVNLQPHAPAGVSARVSGRPLTRVSGRVLTATEMDSVNSFEAPDAVKPAAFEGFHVEPGLLTLELPPKSVTMLEIK